MYKIVIIFLVFTNLALNICAQEGIKQNYAAGEVVSVNQSAGKITLQTKDGVIEVNLSPKTIYKKVSPENPKLSAAIETSINEISAGDKILVSGQVSPDRKSINPTTIYLMTKADISRKQEKEREEWRARGISGKIISLDVVNKRIIISARGFAGEKVVTIIPKDNVEYRKYAPDSIKFSDAKPSSYAELSVGDELRALGDRSPDGTTFSAEKIVFGSFKTAGGKITAIDPQKREIKIKDLLTDKEVTILVRPDTILKRFPAEIAAMFLSRGNQTFQPPQPKPANVPSERPQVRGGDFDDLLERFPSIRIEDLKVGDAIAVASTVGEAPNRLTAIKLLSGIEPFLEVQQAIQSRRSINGQGPGLNIPGLDAISFP